MSGAKADPRGVGGEAAAVRYVVGIDLGTTHCVMATSPADRDRVSLFDVPQLVAPGEVAAATVLPSLLYLPVQGELGEGDLTLPWGSSPYAVGALARRLGSRTPGRLVVSAKSWICYGGVNRRAAILPWGAPDSDPHVSPYDAQVQYLAHLRAAWEHAHPDAPLAAQEVIVTVPASFDDGARELTAAAALEAGLGEVRLIEEPQAAFYDFLAARSEAAEAALRAARLVLIVDVGGGTTDLTLLKAAPAREDDAGEEPQLERIAVGGHLLLGGDNMDAALAHHVVEKAGLAQQQLDPSEWSALLNAARAAKETLLGHDAPAESVVTIQRRGSRLVGATRSVPVRREDVHALLVDGFIPLTSATDTASRQTRAGLTAAGLPYVTDPAISRHVCAFLRRHVEAARAAGAHVDPTGLPRPDLVLLNGGVFYAAALVERFRALLAHWFGAEGAPPVLSTESLEAAVARGAARYALARRGVSGRVIAGGTARAYYVGVQGGDGTRRALCVAPRGMDDLSTVTLPERVYELVLEQPVAFPLFASTSDRAVPAGALVAQDDDDELEPLPPLTTVLRARGEERSAGSTVRSEFTGTVPVTLSATVSETGALELHLTSVAPPMRRWRLLFALGSNADGASNPPPPALESLRASVARTADEPLPPKFPEARAALVAVFGGSDASRAAPGSDAEQRAKRVRNDLEAALGARGEWSAAVCRAVLDLCLANKAGRARSATHELSWLRLSGWCMRPGIGAPGDAERMRALWQVRAEGLAHPNKANWTEWWIVWRRVAPGLDRAQQRELFRAARPFFVPNPGAKGPPPRPPGQPELLQLLAALERLPPADKQAVGEWYFANVDAAGPYWSFGRLGARVPLHGDRADAVPAEVASAWLGRLLALDWKRAEGAAFASAMIARASGDVAHDVGDAQRREVLARLREFGAPASWLELVTNAAALSASDLVRALGESLPAGLRMT